MTIRIWLAEHRTRLLDELLGFIRAPSADEQIHAPHEFFRLSSFDDGLRAWTELFEEAARA